jgi:hypothetical protein
MIPLTRIVKYEDHLDQISDRIAFDMTHAGQCCGGGWNIDDFFRIVIKPFMDAYTYDQDRIDECCVHVIRPGGRAVSFCQYNTIERPTESNGWHDRELLAKDMATQPPRPSPEAQSMPPHKSIE